MLRLERLLWLDLLLRTLLAAVLCWRCIRLLLIVLRRFLALAELEEERLDLANNSKVMRQAIWEGVAPDRKAKLDSTMAKIHEMQSWNRDAIVDLKVERENLLTELSK